MEQTIIKKLYKQKLEINKEQKKDKKTCCVLRTYNINIINKKRNEALHKEFKKKNSNIELPKTPPPRPQYSSLSPQTKTTPRGSQIPPGLVRGTEKRANYTTNSARCVCPSSCPSNRRLVK